jgi:hypothetical protein
MKKYAILRTQRELPSLLFFFPTPHPSVKAKQDTKTCIHISDLGIHPVEAAKVELIGVCEQGPENHQNQGDHTQPLQETLGRIEKKKKWERVSKGAKGWYLE